ncbi:hypothetical protein PDENDC454_08010 [Paenibacillus dendritiformis C454]|uniref:Uncharacterized protein n=1 Tax=Paenibacillus dendritiformis C454 TaxID=1131935 RepID=H3SDN9_9BACL|nr:hypothetical protein PDENDC454_08010 [Paenibacillus dendritiformis C454]
MPGDTAVDNRIDGGRCLSSLIQLLENGRHPGAQVFFIEIEQDMLCAVGQAKLANAVPSVNIINDFFILRIIPNKPGYPVLVWISACK